MRILVIVLLSSAFFLTGCATHNLQRYASIDRANKTITVPPGSDGLKGELKRALAKDGWKLFVYQGPSVTEGELGNKTKIRQYDSFNSRYRLVVSSYQFDLCLNFSPAISYDLSFIDNRSGTEVFTMNGTDCESDVAEKFTKVLQGRDNGK